MSEKLITAVELLGIACVAVGGFLFSTAIGFVVLGVVLFGLGAWQEVGS